MVNKVILIGNLGADPEVRTFESGNKMARLRLATTEQIYNPATSTWNDHTEWHTVMLGQRHVNFAEMYAKKGSQVYIEGRLRRREWGDGAEKRFSVEIRADEFRLLGRRSDNENSSSSYSSQTAAQPSQNYSQSSSQTSSYGAQTQSRTQEYNAYDQPSSNSSFLSGQTNSSALNDSDQTDDIPF